MKYSTRKLLGLKSMRSYKPSIRKVLGIKPLPKILRPKRIRKRIIFRLLVDGSDKVNIRFQDMFGLNPKRKILEKKQDFVTMKELDNTIGKALGIK
jgi:hypothetical protein